MTHARAMNITFRQIRYFLSAAESGSISGAALSVGISQSAITEAIRALEIEVGTPLFHRHAKRVTLTLAGWKATASWLSGSARLCR